MTSGTAQQAEATLSSLFDPIGSTTKYIQAFRTRRGRELAIERSRDGIYLWTEQADDRPPTLPMPEPYPAGRSRNSNLAPNAKRLAPERPVYYWRLESTQELLELCTWYAKA